MSERTISTSISGVHSHARKCARAATFTGLLSGILEFNGGEAEVASILHFVQYDRTKVILAKTTGA